MPNTRNSELCQQTKDSIANAAVDLLLAEPGAELSVTRLCRQAGVSRNAFYRNFDAVEEVVGYEWKKCRRNFKKRPGVQKECKRKENIVSGRKPRRRPVDSCEPMGHT